LSFNSKVLTCLRKRWITITAMCL